jgi:ribosome-binding factor A
MKHRSHTKKQQNATPFDDGGGRFGHGDRKSMQLCAQVRRALEYGVDEVLEGSALVSISDVVPAPNTSHLMVIVQPLGELSFEDSLELQAKLASNSSRLRTLVSEFIHRRKTPTLSFSVLPSLPGVHHEIH